MKKTKSTITRRRDTKKKTKIRPGTSSQQLQRREPAGPDPDREVKEAIGTLKVIAFLLGIVMVGIIVFVAIAMLGKSKDPPRRATQPAYDDYDEEDPRIARNPAGTPTNKNDTKDVTFRDEGSHVVMNGHRYPVVTPADYKEKVGEHVGKAVAMKGTLSNSDVYRGPYADSENSHCAFNLDAGGSSIVLYFGRDSGERLQSKIKSKGSGIKAHVVVKLPKSRYKPGVGDVSAEISKYRPLD